MKKSLIIRWIIIIAVIVGWTASMFPLTEQDFLGKFDKLSAKTVKKLNQAAEELKAEGTLDDVKKKLEGIEDKDGKEFKNLQEKYSNAVKAKTFAELKERIAKVKEANPSLSPFRVLERAAQGEENENTIRLGDFIKVPGTKDAANPLVLRYLRRKTAGKLILGLDLQGGTEFVVGFDKENLKNNEKATDIRDRIQTILENRLNKLGVTEPEIKASGETAISVRMPAVNEGDKADIRKTIKDTAKLEFHLVAENNSTLVNQYFQAINDGKKFDVPADLLRKEITEERNGKETTQVVFIRKEAERIQGEDVTRAQPNMDQFGNWSIGLEFNQRGAIAFGEVTGANVGRMLAIVLDGRVYSAPNIKDAITGGRAEITGSFTFEEAKRLSVVISSGNVPVSIDIVSEFGTDPTLGADSVRSGAIAGIIGLVLVIVFMVWYYKLCGLIADIALGVNTLLVLGSMSITNATITMPGIAGMVLTIGMAVDANVLIFERIRDELKKSKSVGNAIKSGYQRAFSSIFDSNLTTLIACFFLYNFGTGSIKGFAVTLAFGIFASMFTAIFMTRAIYDLLVEKDVIKSISMRSFACVTDKNYDFMKYRKLAVTFSITAVVISILVFVIRGKNMLGIDFAGGTQLLYTVEKGDPSEDAVRNVLAEEGYKENIRVGFLRGQGGDKMLEVVLPNAEKGTANVDPEELRLKLNEKLQGMEFGEGEVRVVGGHVGSQFRRASFLAAFWAIIGVVIYLAFRFEFMYGVAAVVAVIHDIIICAGIYMIFGGRLTPSVIAALMTILGYSLNDTIVIFDRIREIQGLHEGEKYVNLINMSLNDTISRTFLTSLTTFFSTLAIVVIAGGDVQDFAWVMLFGVIVGTYSSNMISTAFINNWHKKSLKAVRAEEGGLKTVEAK